MNAYDMIELPPLPAGYTLEFASAMRNYARAAVEADRQRRGGEPVVWIQRSYLNLIRESNVALHNVVVRGSILNGDGDVVPLFTAPQPAEPVEALSALPSGTNYSVEPHGNGYAIYQGRDGFHHGANLAHLTECTPEFSKRIESALNAMSEPVEVPSDSAIMFEWACTPNTGDMRVDLVVFARALLARYGK